MNCDGNGKIQDRIKNLVGTSFAYTMDCPGCPACQCPECGTCRGEKFVRYSHIRGSLVDEPYYIYTDDEIVPCPTCKEGRN